MIFKFLRNLKMHTTKEQFKSILAATDADIKFNRVSFGKTTRAKNFIDICTSCSNVILKADTKVSTEGR